MMSFPFASTTTTSAPVMGLSAGGVNATPAPRGAPGSASLLSGTGIQVTTQDSTGITPNHQFGVNDSEHFTTNTKTSSYPLLMPDGRLYSDNREFLGKHELIFVYDKRKLPAGRNAHESHTNYATTLSHLKLRLDNRI